MLEMTDIVELGNVFLTLRSPLYSFRFVRKHRMRTIHRPHRLRKVSRLWPGTNVQQKGTVLSCYQGRILVVVTHVESGKIYLYNE